MCEYREQFTFQQNLSAISLFINLLIAVTVEAATEKHAKDSTEIRFLNESWPLLRLPGIWLMILRF